MSNRLALETSPYLLQHAENPVDWYPWGDDAFRAARELDRPILLSIGYSACHWCHVMARESFADPATAALMNRYFVNVKVDREERPDVDQVYMDALQTLTGSGGWPLTAVLTPAGQPFFAGTYFPPDDRPGTPAFSRVLQALASAWQEQREEVLDSATELLTHLREQGSRFTPAGSVLSGSLPDLAVTLLSQQADPVNGGFGGAPKFPPHGVLRFLLLRPEAPARQLALTTLRRMASGGIFDQLGGGFARYTVDAAWVVPHFEKMLYDNAQLLPLYATAFALTSDPGFARVADLTAGWLVRDLLAPEGAFYSALSAESEGSEGRYYLWDFAEFNAAAAPDAALARWWFQVNELPNTQDGTVLTLPDNAWEPPGAEAAPQFQGLTGAQLQERLETVRQRLLAARSQRPRPERDDKFLTSWNGLAVMGLSDAGRLLGRPDLIRLAGSAAEFLAREMWDGSELRHVWSGGQARITGLLEDHACLGLGLLALYRATLEQRWLLLALQLAAVIERDFTDQAGDLFSTSNRAERLVIRPRGLSDAGLPADTAAAATLLLRLGRLTDNKRWLQLASQALLSVQDVIPRQPAVFGTALAALELLRQPAREVVISGSRTLAATRQLAGVVQERYLPFLELVQTENGSLTAELPLLQGRTPVAGQPAAYVCSDGTCRLPVTSPAELLESLGEQRP
jgi:uncharacterized protein YyaL (SSP411 family)